MGARKVIAVSDFVRSFVILHQKVAEDRIHTVRCSAVDVDYFAALAAEREQARSELGVRPDELVIGTVARLDQQKGLFFLLEAFKSLRPSHGNIRLVFVGDGPQRPELERWVERKGLRDAVCFAGFRRDYDRILQSFDIFALPSLWEGLPMTLLAAMASAKPVATTKVSGIPEVIRHDSNGLMTVPGDGAAFAALLRRLLEDESLRNRLGSTARQFVAQHCTAEIMVRGYEKVWGEILNSTCETGSRRS